MGFADFLDDFFDVSVRGSTLGGEVRAGLASFLTVSYILLVNPQILSQSGIPAEDVATATAASAALGSFIAGILGNLPFIIGPGMGLSAYLTFGLIAAGTLTKTQALTSCMVSGVLILLATVTGVANILQKLTAQHIKTAIVVGMGLLIALIGMVQVDLVIAADDGSLVQLGDLSDWKIWLSLGGLVLIGTLAHFSIDGGILFGIISCTMVYWGITGEWPTSWVQVPSLETAWSDNIDLSSLDGNCVMPILAFFFVAIFDVSGVIFGLGKLAGIQQEDETVPGEVWGFIASGAGTVLAAGMGSTPIIAEVESAAGIKEGGRTGLTACVAGIMFCVSLFMAPLFGQIPGPATAPVLMLVGAMMMNESSHIDWQSTRIAIPSFLCAVMMPFTYSIPNGILFGIAGSVVFFITTGEFLERFGCVKAPVPGYAQDSDALLGSVKVQYSAATGTLPV